MKLREPKEIILKDGSKLQSRLDSGDLDLRGEDLSYAILVGAILDGASLVGARLVGARLVGAKYGIKGITSKIWLPFSGLYRYITIPMITDDGTQYVRMGCYVRKRTEWEEDFWNNEKEFPNDGSLESMRRLWAFEFACKWLDHKAKELDV